MTQEKKRGGGDHRLRQFILCLILFGLVLAGRGLDLAPIQQVTAAVSRWVGADTDFQAVFARMGESFSRGEPAAQTIHTFLEDLLPGDRAGQGLENAVPSVDKAEEDQVGTSAPE